MGWGAPTVKLCCRWQWMYITLRLSHTSELGQRTSSTKSMEQHVFMIFHRELAHTADIVGTTACFQMGMLSQNVSSTCQVLDVLVPTFAGLSESTLFRVKLLLQSWDHLCSLFASCTVIIVTLTPRCSYTEYEPNIPGSFVLHNLMG